MKLREHSNLHPLAAHSVSPEFVRLMIKFDAILLACLILFSQTIP